MKLEQRLQNSDFVLMEAAIIEALRRDLQVTLHESLENALLIYHDPEKKIMENLFRSFIDLACLYKLPIMLCAPTWRANKQRLAEALIKKDVNYDSLRFLLDLKDSYKDFAPNIYIGGLMGCKNDAYKPDQALATDEAIDFHSWQAEKITKAEPDYLMGATLPSVKEALGMAYAMSNSGLPYIISFVIGSNGRILDNNKLDQAFDLIDQKLGEKRPLGYMVNCAYPTFLNISPKTCPNFSRLVGFQANASSLDHSQLESSAEMMMDDISDWAEQMARLNRKKGIKIMGGCCGTDCNHLELLIKKALLNKI